MPDIKFESFFGFSTNYATGGQIAKVAYRINCNSEIPDEGKLTMISNILDNYAYPEVMRRIENGLLLPNFKLNSVHLVMHTDETRNEILLNDEVRFLVNPKYKNDTAYEAGKVVPLDEIDQILGLYPDLTNDPNAGHIMLTKFNHNWYFACDLVYNIARAIKQCEKATLFLRCAENFLSEHLWISFLDNLLSASMFLTHSVLSILHTRFSLKSNHQRTIERFLQHSKNGNIDVKYSNNYQKIFELRKAIKHSPYYLGNFHLEETEARELLNQTNTLSKYVGDLLIALSQSRTPQLDYIQFGSSPVIESLEQIKLISLGAIAAEKPKSDNTFKMIFQVNCKDKFLEGVKSLMVTSILDNFAYPEVMRRIKNGSLSSDFRLDNVHLVMYANQNRNETLLNDEVRFMVNVQFNEGAKFEKGQEIRQADIQDILGLYPDSGNDPNAAHIILLKILGKWYCSYDLIYDRKRVSARFNLAKSFLEAATNCLKIGLWGPFVDTLYSGTELAIQSIFLLHHNPKFSLNQTHDETRKLFNQHAKLGNINIKFADHYIKLDELRDKGRYLNGTHGKEFSISESDAKKLVEVSNEVVSYVEDLLKSIDLSKRPPIGEYISVGRIKK